MIQPSYDLKVAIQASQAEAFYLKASVITPEHLLLGLMKNEMVQQILTTAGGNLPKLDAALRAEIYRTQGSSRTTPTTLTTSPEYDSAIQKAFIAAANAGRQAVEVEHLLVALFEGDSSALYCLRQQQIDRLKVLQALSNVRQEEAGLENGPPDDNAEKNVSAQALKKFTVHLNEKARQGRLDPMIGRSTELSRVMQTLCRRRKNNPLLVGEPGVGKTAVAEGLAWNIVRGSVPDALKSVDVYALDMGALIAGTKYRGEFEARLKALVQAVKERPDIVLFIDEIHTLIGAGAGSNTMDASNLLKPALADGTLRVIGATTFQEYREVFERDRALARRFQKIEVIEPTEQETVDILTGLRSTLEAHHKVSYSDAALSTAVALSIKYITDRFLPDKAIDLIDEAGAQQRLLPEGERSAVIEASHIEAVVAQVAKVPVQNVSSDDRAALAALGPSMLSTVFGQDEAIARLTRAIKVARAGLGSPTRPIGSFLFVGPTGVGKTEVTRTLAQTLGVPLLRFDMSEYMESHSVARLIGAPPGYVGHDKGGLLTEAVVKSPHAVLLLDEIEKAHPDVYNILLQVMDNGTLTDTNGRVANFRNVIVVMTSNAGAQSAARRTLGFVTQDHATDGDEAIRRAFSPEFRNRLDATIRFQPLSRPDILRVADKGLFELALLLAPKGVTMDVDAASREWLATAGFDPQMGARPMMRVIAEQLKAPLADLLLFGALRRGGKVLVTVDSLGSGLVLTALEEDSEDSSVPSELAEVV